MKEKSEYIVQKIESLNAMHGKKIRKFVSSCDDTYFELANGFYSKYLSLLEEEGKTLDFGIECYMNMVRDVNFETIDFIRTGKYSSSNFAEVNARVYASPEVMESYMHGLIMSQFLWRHHYQMFEFMMEGLPKYAESTNDYLEIGAGHGLMLSQVLEMFKRDANFSVVDISQPSIDLAKKFIQDERVKYNILDIFNFDTNRKFDFITMGEVLEHVEDPYKLLLKLRDLLNPEGTLLITTPTNAPAIDHIYLFNNVQEIRDLVDSAGLKVASEISLCSEDVSPERAEKYKVSVLYGAFLQRKD